MNKKTLIIIIVVLAVILVGGLVTVFVLSNPATADTKDDLVSSTDMTADQPVQEETEQGQETEEQEDKAETMEGDASPIVEGPADDPTSPTKKNESTKDPTTATKGSQDTNDPTTATKGNETVKDPTTPTKDNTQSTTAPTEAEPEVPYFPEATGTPAPEKDEVTYLDYHSMTATEQKAFINTFESYDAFFEWHAAAKKAYEDSLIEIDGSTPIDMEDIVGGN